MIMGIAKYVFLYSVGCGMHGVGGGGSLRINTSMSVNCSGHFVILREEICEKNPYSCSCDL